MEKNGGGVGDIGDHDPLILGLFRKLPEPEADWPAAKMASNGGQHLRPRL
jgi:hypothetical protein